MDARPKARVSARRPAEAPPSPPVRAHDPVTVVIFGASGDLARRKLVPALHQLRRAGVLPDAFAVVGFARTPLDDEAYRRSMRAALEEFVPPDQRPADDDPLLQSLRYVTGDADDLQAYRRLKERLDAIEAERGLPGNRLYYLSVGPRFFPVIVRNLGAAGLVHPPGAGPWTRVIVEKPFGHDLGSARSLNETIRSVLDESQIYRIDHYLGKETVQNILSFRFGNSIFEPLFSQKYVHNVQITVAETLGMEGRRGAYYDGAGALRDMVQNHLLQLLTLIAMEPPASLDAQSIRDEKVKVVRTLGALSTYDVARSTVRGQYGPGRRDGHPVKGYRQEEGVAPDSLTETYVALRVHLDNWRWAGVPFFLRTGKRLKKRVSEIAVQFKQPPTRLFRPSDEIAAAAPHSNVLVLRIQPDEGISLSFACKTPGMRLELADVDMDFYYGEEFEQRTPEAYERLLLDALRGDASLFTRSDEVEFAWRFITSIHEGWASMPPPSFPNYTPYGEGPEDATKLVEGTCRWRTIEEM